MPELDLLLANNAEWAAALEERDPSFFEHLAHQQAPAYLWIGCSDSRVPANQLVGLLPGEMFVHRNVANVVVHSDLNCLSVLHFAIDVLQVRHIIVCGHYGCGGVKAALEDRRLGLIDNWLRHVQDVMHKHQSLLDELDNEQQRLDRLCELNVVEQVVNVCRTTLVQQAWAHGQAITVHGWVYGVHDGRLRDLDVSISSDDHLAERYEQVMHRL